MEEEVTYTKQCKNWDFEIHAHPMRPASLRPCLEHGDFTIFFQESAVWCETLAFNLKQDPDIHTILFFGHISVLVVGAEIALLDFRVLLP
jgi:hypothetical protein